MARNILIAYDGTESAKRALDRAADLQVDGDHFLVVSVTPFAVTGPRSAGPIVQGDTRVEHLAEIDEARAVLGRRGIEARGIEAIGDPGRTICEVAEREHVDTIVIGSRNLNGAKRLLLGSVSDRVVHHAHCDVLVAK
jgi:nucleotide-binding universal stress UspA family protein